MKVKQKESIKRAALWLPKRILMIITLACAMVLAGIFGPGIRDWALSLLPHPDYQVAATLISHEMEKTGELIAVRNTDTGILNGKVNALLVGTVAEITAPYQYENGLGVKMDRVVLTAEENRLTVAVPEAELLYDSFQITAPPKTSNFWNYSNETRYQRMQDEQLLACRQKYLDDPVYMEQAWSAVCEQLESLFRQWSGENLNFSFVHAN